MGSIEPIEPTLTTPLLTNSLQCLIIDRVSWGSCRFESLIFQNVIPTFFSSNLGSPARRAYDTWLCISGKNTFFGNRLLLPLSDLTNFYT